MFAVPMILRVPIVTFAKAHWHKPLEPRRRHIKNIVSGVREHRAEKDIEQVEQVICQFVHAAFKR